MKQKILAEIEKRYEYWKEKEHHSHSVESEIRMSECQHLLQLLNFLPEEPVSEDLEEASRRYALNNTPYDDCADEMQEAFKAGAQWQKERLINKALQWLEKNWKYYDYPSSLMFDDFRKAMEE